MKGIGRTRKLWLTALVLGVALLIVDCQSLQPVESLIFRNVSGFLVSENGRFYIQPASLNKSASAEGFEEEVQQENESHGSDKESWSMTNGGKNESGLHASVATANEEEKDAEDDNYIAWQRSRQWWWRRWMTPTSRARGFSIYGMFESAFNIVTKFIGSLLGDDDGEEDVDYQSGLSYKGHQLLRITPKNLKQLKNVEELRDNEPDNVKFWTVPAKDKITDVLISPTMLNDVKDFLRQKKIDYVILIPDLQKVIKSQNPRMPKERRQDLVSSQGHSMTWKRYHRYKDVMGYLDHLAMKYPQLVDVVTIGKSFEGRPLKVIKISSGVKRNGERKPSIWIDAGMHAREWISTAVATYVLSQLVEKNENYTRLLDVTDWIIMPIANPDGYEYTHTEDRLWRKTRSTHDADSEDETRQSRSILHVLTHYTKWLFGTCEGVDPNRNFNVHWGEDKVNGASKDPCHDTYAGPSPFSESETRAIANYIMENRNTIRTYLTLHSYSQMLLVPWGFTRAKPADFEDLMNIANKAKTAIAKVHGTEYKVGPATELLYPTTGSSDDWAKAIAGIKNAFTMELRDRGAYGYLLPASQIVPTARETWAGVRVIARMAAANISNT